METTILCLPQHDVEAVLEWLPLRDVSRAGRSCRGLRRAACSVLRRAVRRLVLELEGLLGAVEAALTPQAFSCLRALLVDARLLMASCWRHMRTDALCLPAGELLDSMFRVLRLATDGDLDPGEPARLALKTDRFLDFFDSSLEPHLTLACPCSMTPFGVKVLDLLDCCHDASYHLTLTHELTKEPFVLNARYELYNLRTAEVPENMSSKYTPPEAKLQHIGKFIRNCVRLNNLANPFIEQWNMKAITEDDNFQKCQLRSIHRHNIHEKLFKEIFSSGNVVHSKYFTQCKQVPDNHIHRDEFVKQQRRGCGTIRLSCDIQYQAVNKDFLPLHLEFLKMYANKAEDSTNGILQNEAITRDQKTQKHDSDSVICFKSHILNPDATVQWPKCAVPGDHATSSAVKEVKSTEDIRNSFYLTITIQYPILLASNDTEERNIYVYQTDSKISIKSSDDVISV